MENDYLIQLKDQIINILKDHPNDLQDIVEKVDGAFPPDIIKVLKSLGSEYPEVLKFMTRSVGKEQSHIKSNDTRVTWILDNLKKLSKAHPADYDWRFTAETTDKLSTFIGENWMPKKVGLFGVATLHVVLNHYYPLIETYLVNKSKSLINDLRKMGFEKHLINHDLFNTLPAQLSLDLIVADPPWYLDFYKAFILRASQSLRLNGYLMLSVLPKLTRPNAQEDAEIIDEICVLCGFEKVETKSKYFTYETPDFEKKALEENAVDVQNWRHGDLIIYKKTAENSSKISLDFRDTDPLWLEYLINDKKVKIRHEADNQLLFNYKYVASHKTLPSVSRRYEKRAEINFWTSDNIAFNVTNLAPLKAFFTKAESGESISELLSKESEKLNLSETDLTKLKLLLLDAELI